MGDADQDGRGRVAGTRYGGAQVGLPACFVILEPGFILNGAEPGDTVNNGVAGAVDVWGVVVYNGGKGMGLVVWEVSFVVLGV
jgi:hypothetical protein